LQETALDELRKELQARPTAKLVEDLRKKVKILQVITLLLSFFLPNALKIVVGSQCF